MKYPMMPIWVNDLRQCPDYKMMSREARSFYLDLIFECWAQGGEIPADYKSLSKLLGDDPRTCRRLLAQVQRKFNSRNGLLNHGIVNQELGKQHERIQKAKDAANKRWKKEVL